jgi:hypothetical protein
MIRHGRYIASMFLLVLPLSGCQCQDTMPVGWELEEPEGDAMADVVPDAPPMDVQPDVEPDTRDIGPDTRDVVDIRDAEPDIDAWQPEELFDVPCTESELNDRTSLAIDDNGTLWLGHHKFQRPDCSNPTLVVNRKRLEGRWVREDIQPHEGIFGLSIIDDNRPIAVFPDRRDGTFEAVHRRGNRDWEFHTFDIGSHRVRRGDGFDVTNDGERFFVTFAGNNAPQVRLFSAEAGNGAPDWESRRSLFVEDPSAAMERGLRADTDDSVYLVHENEERNRYGLARYDKDDDLWKDRVYFNDANRRARVHSFVIREDFELCMSSRLQGQLLVTCGTMFDLQQDRTLFDQEISRRYPSSMIEGDDGTLYVVFHPDDNSELRVAKRPPGGEWSVQTVYDGSSFGISTAIDMTGDLVMAFYTCGERGQECTLKVLRERPDEL